MWGIRNYEPDFVSTTDEVLDMCRRFSSELIGGKIECIWVSLLQTDNSWWEDAPVIIRVNGRNYEFCWMKESDFSLTSNLIDVEKPIYWCGGEEIPLIWQKDALPVLQRVVGHLIVGFHLIEAQVEITNHSEGFHNKYQIPYAIQLTLSEGQLCLFNAFDRNGLTDEKIDGDGFRSIEIQSQKKQL